MMVRSVVAEDCVTCWGFAVLKACDVVATSFDVASVVPVDQQAVTC